MVIKQAKATAIQTRNSTTAQIESMSAPKKLRIEPIIPEESKTPERALIPANATNDTAIHFKVPTVKITLNITLFPLYI